MAKPIKGAVEGLAGVSTVWAWGRGIEAAVADRAGLGVIVCC